MKFRVFIVFLSFLSGNVFSQKLGSEDTLLITDRTFGTTQELMHVMDGFSASFFFQTQQSSPNPIELLKPGFTSFFTATNSKKPILFSALPHLGFGYGFGAQGSQVLRLDYEQFFTQNILLNLRYDRWQRSGFVRADDLRFSGLQVRLYQKGKAHELQLSFDNASDDRQWSGGIADYTQLNTIALELIPVLKEQSFTQKNSYNGTIDLRYRLLGDSLRRINLASFHAYSLQQRVYNEWGNLDLYYPETFLNVDSCIDTFRQVYLDNRVGLSWEGSKLNVLALLGVKQRQWSDPVFNYDTLEVNWNNKLVYADKLHSFNHSNTINLIGADQGVNFNTKYVYSPTSTKIDFSIKHNYSHEWPQLMQRGYLSNLTQYSWSNPQKEKFQLLEVGLGYATNPLSLSCFLSLLDFESVYRFDPSNMKWTNTATASKGQLAMIRTNLKYVIGPLNLSSSYQFLAQNNAQFLPKHRADLSLLWKGGLFKQKRLKMALEAQLSYQSSFQGLTFLPFIESIDWIATQNAALQNGFMNAQFNVALEVKTFRFFVNVANLGSFWNAREVSVVQGFTFAPMQVRIGLTWDFWN
jgi:hypothetical protein